MRRRVLRHLTKATCVRVTKYYKLADECFSSGAPSEKGRPTKEEIQTKRQEYQESHNAIEKSVFFSEEEKATLRQRADDQLNVLAMQESDYQTDNGKSKKLMSELGSTCRIKKDVEELYPTPHIHEQMTAYIMATTTSTLSQTR